MIGSFVLISGVVCLVTVVNLLIAAWVAHRFLSEREAKIAAFAFMMVAVVFGGPRGFLVTQQFSQSESAAALLGFALGAILIWFQFFRSENANV